MGVKLPNPKTLEVIYNLRIKKIEYSCNLKIIVATAIKPYQLTVSLFC